MALPQYSGIGSNSTFNSASAEQMRYMQKSSDLQMQMLENAVSQSRPTAVSGGSMTGAQTQAYAPRNLSVASGGNFAIPTVGGGVGAPSASEASYDPWSRYRAAAGDQLAASNAAGDPSDIYKQKLAAMSTGTFTPDDPSYQFRYDQGLQANERSLAAKGLLNSGNAAIELQNYGQKAASQEYGAQFSRMLEGLNGVSTQYDKQQQRLMEMAGINIDPTSGGKLGVAQTSNAIDAMKANQTYDLGSRGLLQSAQSQLQSNNNNNASQILSNWF